MQKAELRIAVVGDGAHALLGQVNVRGSDIYSGPSPMLFDGKKREFFRSSYHASGATRLHLPVGTTAGRAPSPPDQVVGSRRYAWGGATYEWTYRPKKDSAYRRTVMIPVSKVARGWSVDYWVIEHGRVDLVEQIVNPPVKQFGSQVVDYVVSDWTRPFVAMVVSTATTATWASFTLTELEDEVEKATPRWLSLKGVALAYLGRHDEALDHHNRALQVSPEHPGLLYNRACGNALAGRFTEGLVDLQRAVSLSDRYRAMASQDEDLANLLGNSRFAGRFQTILAAGPPESR